ncbi:MAG: hypothetical protein Q8N23_16150 [Archangium sp.]|nr:hypothetical protein [Archangium sp.]MDP3154209.1 hypothetical protein [Archangium sp.]MDP3569548.1 hypothetical protein [Archangium sp.]
MIKPIAGVDRVTRLLGIAETPPIQPTPVVLAPATWRTATSPLEEALRAALHQFAAALGRVETEPDPLTRHLGFRTVRRELNEAAVAPQNLSDPEEQAWAKSLVDSARAKEHATLGALDAQARSDLEVLLTFERRLDERHAADVLRKAATQDQLTQRAVLSRLQRDTERRRADFVKLESSRRPKWARVLGVVIAICSFGVLALRMEFDASPLLSRVTLAGVIFSGLLGSWLALDSRQRRAWLKDRLEELATLRQSAAEREAHAKEHLTHALKLFDEVDAQCQREEAAARAVLLRLPGAERYLRTSGPVVAFSVR